MTFERMTAYESVGGHAHAVPTGDADKAMMRLAAYEDTDLRPEDIVEYKKFEDWLVQNGITFSHVIELLQAEKDGLVMVRKRYRDGRCGGCYHFLREKQKRSGVCEVRRYKYYPKAGQPLCCYQSTQACLDFEDLGERPARYMEDTH